MKQTTNKTRRTLLRALLATSVTTLLWPSLIKAKQNSVISKRIPSSGETIPIIGLGSWITFNVGNDSDARDACAGVIDNFIHAGGRLIDSSPMYGSSQEVIGYSLDKLGKTSKVFSAEKVWTSSSSEGREQMETTRRYWKVKRFDLMQVHNVLSWKDHLPTLFDMKAAGKIRYVGITTSHGRRHREIEHIMRNHPIDFVQMTYNIRDREVEKRLLPLAQDRGIAVIANRPFQQGSLIDWAKRYPLPGWIRDIDCSNWAQFLLKFIVSHPAVTCSIPATSRVDHVLENLGAATGHLPDDAMRRRMIAYVKTL